MHMEAVRGKLRHNGSQKRIKKGYHGWEGGKTRGRQMVGKRDPIFLILGAFYKSSTILLASRHNCVVYLNQY